MKIRVTGFRETWKGLPIKYVRFDDDTWEFFIHSYHKDGGSCSSVGGARTLKEARNNAHKLIDEEVLQRSDVIVPELREDGTYKVWSH